MTYTPEERRAWARRIWRERREAWFADKGCVTCGTTEDLQLDHIDPEDKKTHQIWHWRQERREEELAKCQPMCRHCHNEKHNGPRRKKHGSSAMYRHHGCRCETCVQANRARARNYLDRKRGFPAGILPKGPRPRPLVHGTTAGYKKGCRCSACRRAVADYNNALYHKKKKERSASTPLF